MPKAIKDEEMLNKKFGKWLVLEKAARKKGERIKWKCQCDCGTIKDVSGTALRSGKSQSCGCRVKEINTIDLTGQIFGELTVLEKTTERYDNSVVWKCQCSCGNECFVSSHNLRQGRTRSCGHLVGQNFKGGIDITGMRFGKLIALYPTEERSFNSIVWACQCDCGNIYNASIHRLREGKIKSCGCLKRSYGEEKIATLLTKAGMIFVVEKKFNDLGQYRFDFYVNDSYLIEFDGKQHFSAQGGFGWFTQEAFEKTQERDQIKNNWCKDNNIPLIRIPYYIIDNITIEDLILETTKYRVA